MTRNVVLKLALPVFLASLVAGGAPARALVTQASIAVVPAAPAVGDIVHVVVEGVAGGCGVGFVGLDVAPGTTGLLYVVRLAEGAPPGEFCPAAELPFTVEATLGRVPAGSHEVRVESHDLSDPDTVQHVGTRSFTVAGEPGSALVLHGGRFHVEVSWEDFDDHTGVGRVVPGASEASGLFWFFGPDNWELLIKVLDGCAFNNRWWVLGAAATTVRYVVVVTDTLTGEVWRYENPLGQRSPAFADTTAFRGCPP